MLRLPSASGRLSIRYGRASAPILLILACASVTPAFAQGTNCDDFANMLVERRTIIQKLSAVTGKKQIDPKSACTGFTGLVTNGTKALKWLEVNKDWCQVPDNLSENIKNDHKKASDLKGQACTAAAKQAKAAQQQQQQGGGGGGSGGLLGGEGLTGSFKMPQGAL